MQYIIAKLLLPILLPILLAATKVAVDKLVPNLYSKIPKQMWMVLVPILVEASTQFSPDLLLFPGMPAWASTALLSVGALGTREFMTQLLKLADGDTAPAGTLLTSETTPTGM